MSSWKGKSKGTPLGYKIFIRIIQLFGVGFTYRILRFVVFYYYLFATTPKRNLRLFYSKVPGLNSAKISRIIRRNFNLLGESLVDRFAFLIGKGDKITYTEEGEKYLRDFAERKQPLILISAHIGNWEIAGNLLKKLDAKVNVVMFDGESEKLKKLLKNEVGESHFNIISIKPNDLSHIYQINNAIKSGEMVCIHGDRFIEGAKTIPTKLFGQPIDLPYGSFQIASRLKAHHCFIFAVKDGKYNYHFTSTQPELLNRPEQVAEKYVEVLEEKIKANPEQWFNYFPFFKENASQ
ncbi:MAG: hypothetical protein MI810_00105 [Flavobacteriales bacterium]|jgi:predicted LPLAT superfamily acyltransferase|nr:hypothetical protein [Flavobacteriales bacterium]